MRFLDLGLHDPAPDATTIWLFREALVEAKLIDTLFQLFDQHLTGRGFIARGGQIIDATIVSAPKQRNTREENETVKAGKTPADWEKKPAKNSQKDKDARWTKKHGKSYYGYKNHVGIDKTHKLIRKWDTTDASVHDSQKIDDILDPSNTGRTVWADSAYRSAEIEAKLTAMGLKSRVHLKGVRGQAAFGERQRKEYGALGGARPRRAHIRTSGDFVGAQHSSHHRQGARPVQDRHDEPRLQHAPVGAARADGDCVRVNWLRQVESVLRRETAPAARHAGAKKPATGFKPPRVKAAEAAECAIVRGALQSLHAERVRLRGGLCCEPGYELVSRSRGGCADREVASAGMVQRSRGISHHVQ